MNPAEILHSAFSNLDVFSIPGLGTFVRKNSSAKLVDGSWTPPFAYFEFEKQIVETNGIEKWIQLKGGVNSGDSDLLARKISNWILHHLHNKGKFVIPGIGELTLRNNVCELKNSPVDTFGLNDVESHLGIVAIPPVSPKTEVINKAEEKIIPVKTPKDSSTTNKETPTPVKEEKASRHQMIVMKPKRKRRKLWPVFLLLLLAGAATTGILFRAEITVKLYEWGILKSDSTKTDTTQVANNIVKDSNNTVNNSTRNTTQNHPPTISGNDDFNDLAEPWKPGYFYLVYECTLSIDTPPASLGYLRQWKDMDVRVLQPDVPGGYYKVTVFNSANKKLVIAKMVEWKVRLKNKTWIYPPNSWFEN